MARQGEALHSGLRGRRCRAMLRGRISVPQYHYSGTCDARWSEGVVALFYSWMLVVLNSFPSVVASSLCDAPSLFASTMPLSPSARISQGEVEGEAKPKRVQRMAAFDWLLAVDWQLQCCLGRGLSEFLPSASAHLPLHRRPMLCLSLDKGSDGFSAVWFLIYQKAARVVPVFDPFHSPWRELDGVMKECGLKSSMLLLTVGHNLEFGPWDGQAFHCALVDAAAELQRLCTPDDPLVNCLWPRICRDRGTSEDDAIAKAALLKGLSESEWLFAHGPRVCSSRWGT